MRVEQTLGDFLDVGAHGQLRSYHVTAADGLNDMLMLIGIAPPSLWCERLPAQTAPRLLPPYGVEAVKNGEQQTIACRHAKGAVKLSIP